MNEEILAIDHIQLAAPVGCEEAARAFFGEPLGLEEIGKPAALRARGECWFRLGSLQVHIGVEEPFHPSLKAHHAFAVARIEALFERLQRSRIECSWDAALEGRRRFFAADPWGNRFELTEPSAVLPG